MAAASRSALSTPAPPASEITTRSRNEPSDWLNSARRFARLAADGDVGDEEEEDAQRQRDAGRDERSGARSRGTPTAPPISVGRASAEQGQQHLLRHVLLDRAPDQPEVGLERAHVEAEVPRASGPAVTPTVRPNRSSPCEAPWSRLAMPTSAFRRLSRSIGRLQRRRRREQQPPRDQRAPADQHAEHQGGDHASTSSSLRRNRSSAVDAATRTDEPPERRAEAQADERQDALPEQRVVRLEVVAVEHEQDHGEQAWWRS